MLVKIIPEIRFWAIYVIFNISQMLVLRVPKYNIYLFLALEVQNYFKLDKKWWKPNDKIKNKTLELKYRYCRKCLYIETYFEPRYINLTIYKHMYILFADTNFSCMKNVYITKICHM